MAPQVSIVVPAYNHSNLTKQCLDALFQYTPAEDYQLIVVDNGSTDDTQAVLAAMATPFTVLHNVDRVGFGHACNQGAAAAQTGYVLFLSNDVVVGPGWLAPLQVAMDEDARRGAVQPRLLHPSGVLNHAGGLVFARGDTWVYGKRDIFPYAPKYSCRRAPDYASGACLLVRKEAFDSVGGFDLRYSAAYYEDTDLSFALRAAGWTLLYEPATTVVHLEGASNDADVAVGEKAYNHELFAEKWAAELAGRPVMARDAVEAWAHRPQHGRAPGEQGDDGNPQRVLVVDVVPPMYDRAGGCLRSFQMIRALRAAGHSVAFYAVGQAIERVRYGAALSRIGVPLYGADPRERADLEGASEPALQVWSSLHTPQIAALCHDRQVDVVIVAPWTTAKAVLAHIRTTVPGARVIVDSVDLAFVREEREAAFQSCGAAELARRREQELDVYRAADQVVCSSQREADVLKAALAGCDVRVVGLCNDALPAASSQGQRSGLLTVANANHPPNLDGLAWYAKEIGPRLAELLPGVKLTVIGNDPVGALAQLASEHVEVIGWVPDTRPYLEKARVSVAPLRYGAGVKGKVAEALAAGLPVVGTTMAVEGMGLTAGLDVEVADDPAMFAAAIARLYKDADRWEEMQRNGRAAAERTAGVANMARQMASLMGSRFAPVPDGWTSPFAPSAPAAAAPAPSHGAEVATTAPMPKPDAPTLDLAAARAPAAPQATAQGQATASARPHSGRVTAPGPVGGAGRGKVARRGGQGHRAGTTGSAAKPGRVLISACLIVKDEEEALPECLASLRGLADEVVVYDTGSTDATIDIARRSGAKVIEGYWDDDFGRARNASLAQCRGEWILWIDADERFRCENTPQLRSMLQKGFEQESLAIEIYNLADDLEDANINIHRALRMFKRSRCQWYGSIHEQVDLRPGLEGKVQAMPVKGAYIEHIGYRSEVVNKRDKLVRNLRLAEAALVKDTVGDMRGQEGVPELNMGRALSALGRFEEAQPYFDASLAIVGPGVTRRVSLMFDAQNLMSLGRYAEAAEVARQFGDACEKKGLGRYLEGLCYRRLGDPAKAVELLAAVEGLDNEDGFVFAVTLLRAELAGALCDLGRFGEAADQLALLVEESSDVHHIRAALKVFAYTGRSLEELAAAMPENRLEKMAAALLLVPPVVADPVAEALFRRFGARPLLLAAAIRFAPMVATQRALEWSARLRQIGMTEPCPLIGQAMIDILEVPVRVRAAVTAHAAFGDERGADLAVALAPGLHHDQLALAVKEVCLLDPPLVARFCPAAAAPGAPDAGAVGSEADRRLEVASALEDAGHGELAAQIRKHDGAVAAGPQLVILGADR